MRTARSVAAVALTLAAAALPAPAATLVVANKGEATASLLDLRSGAVVATLPTGNGPHEVAISPDGKLALVTNYGQRDAPGSSLTLIDVVAARVKSTIDLKSFARPHGVVWIDGRTVLVTVEDNRAVVRVDVKTGRVLDAIETEQDVSHMVALHPKIPRAFVANIRSGSVTVLDVESRKRLRTLATGDGAEGVTVTADGRQVWVTNRAADTIAILDSASLEVVKTFASVGFPIRAVAAGDRVLVTRARAGDLVVYDAKTHEVVRTVTFDLKSLGADKRLFGDRFGDSSVPIGVVPNADATRAFVAHANADVITEVDLKRGTVVRQLRAGREPDGMGYTPRDVRAPRPQP